MNVCLSLVTRVFSILLVVACGFAALSHDALASVFAQTIPGSPDPNIPTIELWVMALAVLTTIAGEVIALLPENLPGLAKRGIVAVIALIFAVTGVYYEGRLDFGDIGRTWLIVFLAATALYHVIIKPIQNNVRDLKNTPGDRKTDAAVDPGH